MGKIARMTDVSGLTSISAILAASRTNFGTHTEALHLANGSVAEDFRAVVRAYGQPEALTLEACGISVPDPVQDAPVTLPEAAPVIRAEVVKPRTPAPKAEPAPTHDDGLGW